MARQTGAEAIRGVVGPAVDGAGLYLEDVVVQRAGSRSVVRIVVDLPEDRVGSVDLDAIAEVSREISTALDSADVVAGVYTLEVSTPGVGRALTEPRHFTRARTRLVRLRLRDGGIVTGRLTAVDDALHLDDSSGPSTVPLSDVASGQVEVELTRTGDDPVISQDDHIDEEA